MAGRLDTPVARFYKSRPLWAAAVVVWSAVAWAEIGPGGAQLPDGVQKVGENRYRSPKDFDDLMDYYKKVYPRDAYPRKSIVNQPGVKAVHIVNPSGKGFEGLNIYEANDEVRIYVVVSEKAKKKEPKGKKKEEK